MTPVTAALDILEDAILSALNALSPASAAFWNAEATNLYTRLALPASNTDALSRAWIAQHQDGGGQRDARIHSQGWTGLVVVRCLSRTQATARAGLQLAAPALQSLAPAAGYAITMRWDRPVAIPKADTVYTAAGQWIASVRRTA